jgi:hypothetical protein
VYQAILEIGESSVRAAELEDWRITKPLVSFIEVCRV